jgi:pimeloyl-ACP methyl ester carboxylesterase
MKSIPALPPPLPAQTTALDDQAVGPLSAYVAGPAGPGDSPPLVLVHSVNAAASAAEIRPLFERYRSSRPTYALDLPGFGLSDRSDRRYTPRLMTDALHACVRRARADHGGGRVDILAVSLGCEFVARAITENPDAFRSVALVSPTGFSGTRAWRGKAGTTRAIPGLHAALACPLWGRTLFGLLTKPSVIRYFLERTWGGPDIDEDLWAYDVLTTRQRGAHHAPLYFLSGGLFSADVTSVYERLMLPVWMAHGVRGDFVDYRGAKSVLERAHWGLTIFETGALPYFEEPEPFFVAYEGFLSNLPRAV